MYTCSLRSVAQQQQHVQDDLLPEPTATTCAVRSFETPRYLRPPLGEEVVPMLSRIIGQSFGFAMYPATQFLQLCTAAEKSGFIGSFEFSWTHQ